MLDLSAFLIWMSGSSFSSLAARSSLGLRDLLPGRLLFLVLSDMSCSLISGLTLTFPRSRSDMTSWYSNSSSAFLWIWSYLGATFWLIPRLRKSFWSPESGFDDRLTKPAGGFGNGIHPPYSLHSFFWMRVSATCWWCSNSRDKTSFVLLLRSSEISSWSYCCWHLVICSDRLLANSFFSVNWFSSSLLRKSMVNFFRRVASLCSRTFVKVGSRSLLRHSWLNTIAELAFMSFLFLLSSWRIRTFASFPCSWRMFMNRINAKIYKIFIYVSQRVSSIQWHYQDWCFCSLWYSI